MKAKHWLYGIIFDLDGTLLDTLEDIADAENAALAEFGLAPLPVDDYRYIVGGGAENIARKLLPEHLQDEQHLQDYMNRFRHYYHLNWHNKSRLYPGVSAMIDTLIALDVKLAILSNKPEEFALKIVEYFFPNRQGERDSNIFTHVIGQRSGFPTKPDPALALSIVDAWHCEAKQVGFMGDSDVDILTALRAGMLPLGAEWGFRGRDELLSSGAEIVLTNPMDLFLYLDQY